MNYVYPHTWNDLLPVNVPSNTQHIFEDHFVITEQFSEAD